MVRTGPDLAGFSRWVRRVLGAMKSENDWGITKVALEAEVARSTITLWRDADWSKGIPTRAAVEKFCENLKLKKDEPFAYMRWTLEPRDEVKRDEQLTEPPPEPDLDRLIRRIEIRLDQKPPVEERRELELKLVRARRARDAQRLADELIDEIRPDLDAAWEDSA
jgi:hypothetical protein